MDSNNKIKQILLDLTSKGFSHGKRYRDLPEGPKGVCEEIKQFLLDNIMTAFNMNNSIELIWNAGYNPEDLGEENTVLKVSVAETESGKQKIMVRIWYPGAYYDCGDQIFDKDDYEDACEMNEALDEMFEELNVKPLFVPLWEDDEDEDC